MQEVREEGGDLVTHRSTERLVEGGKNVCARCGLGDSTESEPLRPKAIDQRARSWIGEHAHYGGTQALVRAQRATASVREQLVVWHAAPQKIGETTRKTVVIERYASMLGLGIGGRIARAIEKA